MAVIIAVIYTCMFFVLMVLTSKRLRWNFCYVYLFISSKICYCLWLPFFSISVPYLSLHALAVDGDRSGVWNSSLMVDLEWKKNLSLANLPRTCALPTESLRPPLSWTRSLSPASSPAPPFLFLPPLPSSSTHPLTQLLKLEQEGDEQEVYAAVLVPIRSHRG